MSIRAQLESDLKEALRSREELRKSTIRLLLAALKNQQIENRAPLDVQQELGVLQREAKRRRETAEEYKRLGRPDMAQKESAEYEIVQTYLPQPLTTDELKRLVAESVESTAASSPRDMGRVMGALQPLVRGRADGKVVSGMVRETLAAKEAAG